MAESCNQCLTADTFRRFTVGTDTCLRTRKPFKTLSVNRSCHILCTGICILCTSYNFVHANDHQNIFRSVRNSCHTVCISIYINQYPIFRDCITACQKIIAVKCLMHHLCFFLRCRTQISVQHFIISFMKCFRKTNCLNAHRPSPTDAASFRNQLQCKGKCLFFGLYIMSLHLTGLQILYHLLSEQIISLCNEFIHYSTTWIHPSGASMCPI